MYIQKRASDVRAWDKKVEEILISAVEMHWNERS